MDADPEILERLQICDVHSQKWIADLETSKSLAMLHILREKDLAPRLDGGRDDQRVKP
jgi:hypothetical protein